MQYAAMIFDVIESRRYFNRYDVQDILMSSVEYLNKLYGFAIKKSVVASAGDEFQGLFVDLKSAFLYVRKLQLLVYPIRIRCGIGYGDIKYDVEEWTSTAIDGGAYYLARDAVMALERKKNNAICFHTKSRYDKYLNEFCFSNMWIKSKQSLIVHVIELIADIMLPITSCDESMDYYDFIFNKKINLIRGECGNIFGNRFRDTELLDLDFCYLSEMKDNFKSPKSVEEKFCMEEFWARGMSIEIAKIMNTTRQNIDRYISLGRVKESRTMDKTIYELLGENIW